MGLGITWLLDEDVGLDFKCMLAGFGPPKT